MALRILLVTTLVILATAGIYLLVGDSDGEPPGEGMISDTLVTAPDFELERLGGRAFRLSEERGKVVVLNIWATWCPPCREEIPDLITIQDEMREQVVVVGVSIDTGDPADVEAFSEEFGINYPVVIDDGTVTEKYGPILGIPTTFLIDGSGRLQLKASGMVTREQLRPVLDRLAADEVIDEAVPRFQRIRKKNRPATMER